jgi:DNA-binding response OmpR family regulator
VISQKNDRMDLVITRPIRHVSDKREAVDCEEQTTLATILVVEDDVALSGLLRSHLEADGHTVVQAFDGPTALIVVEQHQPHLIMLDWMLPGMDGLAVCRRLRQQYLTPIIMLTARTEEVDQILGLEVGADDYIAKPFSIRQVLARVRAMLRRVELDSQPPERATISQPFTNANPKVEPPPQVQAPAPLVYGVISISEVERSVRLAGQLIDLTPKEYDLLVLLTSHPGWVFKREVLLQQIWGDSYDGFDRTIDNHVTRLRKKLGMLGEKIETVWGVGYRFKA